MLRFLGFAAPPVGLALLVALAIPAAPVQAQGAPLSSPVEFARKAEQLRPGQWVWAAEVAPQGPVLVYVDLARQLATVYRNGVRIAVTTVSSGKPGHETPTGVFTILQKDAHHRSSTYNNAPMPYQQRLTWDGVALHAGGLPGYPESHGCVHLPMAFARQLFATTDMGGTVIVNGRAGSVAMQPSAGVLAPADGKGRRPRMFRWARRKAIAGSPNWHRPGRCRSSCRAPISGSWCCGAGSKSGGRARKCPARISRPMCSACRAAAMAAGCGPWRACPGTAARRAGCSTRS
ncbi:L,D-transpeptidase family protein [Sphingomonas changnyeongensis]|uniref:L,D-transpeptidase family protein n=1 Tax=Sphingomonas changnyeongensis TaxID=2698679 RepID=UPI001E33EE63|nr:L,D-transpeptidase family protein [Sphingomonas changnyeongensis]